MNVYVDRYRAHGDAFDRKVAAVQPGQWEDPSPCADWTARGVVQHIVDMHAAMLRPLGRTLSAAASVSEDPLAAFRAARADVEAPLGDPSIAGAQCPTPMGPMSYEVHVDQVVSDDMVMHGWDLARATGQDTTIDPADVERMWAACRQLPAELNQMMRTPDAFGPGIEVLGPEVPVKDDASDEQRLIAFFGRNPY